MLSNFMTIDIPSHGPSPSSTGAGLPPRPNSAKLMLSGRNLLPKGSFRAKYLSQSGEKTVLDIPDTPMLDKPSTSMTCSLSKVFSSSKKSAQSLPVSPVANLGPQSAMETDLDGHSEISVSVFRSYHTLRFVFVIIITGKFPILHRNQKFSPT